VNNKEYGVVLTFTYVCNLVGKLLGGALIDCKLKLG
jgi:hypothetical protein